MHSSQAATRLMRSTLLSTSSPSTALFRYSCGRQLYQPARRYNSTVQDKILQRALDHVPELGFTQAALAQGAKDAGYLDVTANVFPNGPFHIVNLHLTQSRLALQNVPLKKDDVPMKTGQAIRTLCRERLRENERIAHRLQEALALMAVPSNASTSLAELARLADEMWYLAGDQSVDTSWYTKRASLSALYAASELFMSQDHSPAFTETYAFLDRRLEDIARFGSTTRDVGEWLGFSTRAFVNVLRSKGVRI